MNNRLHLSLGLLAASIACLVVIGCGKTQASETPPPSTSSTAKLPAHTFAEAKEVFDKNCVGCHAGNNRQGRLSLDTHENILKGGESGPGFVAGDYGASLIVQHMRGEKDQMPPMGKLSDEQIEIVAGWIGAGAPAE